ncbi:MAG: NYN domain-containing protein [Isosphaeraceae bacterium]
MRWVIDGYNIMHAGGRLGPKVGREAFRRARRRFLDDLAHALGSERAGQTTVVFDASVPPGDFPLVTTYRGIHLVFALDDEDADTRIEQIIAHDSNPRNLTVISSDHRIRQAASRRRAKPLTAEQFWDWFDDLRAQATLSKKPKKVVPDRLRSPDRGAQPSIDEAAFWLETFRDLETAEVREAIAPNKVLLTDAEIAEIQRQVDREV